MGIEDIFGKKEVIYGPMASGKSLELIRRISRYKPFQERYGFDIHCFRPVLDTRRLSEADQTLVESSKASRLGNRLESRSGLAYGGDVHQITEASEIYRHLTEERRSIIAIEDAQLLDGGLIEVVPDLAKQGHYVIACMLDLSFRGESFPFSCFEKTASDFIRLFTADEKIHLSAICDECGKDAWYTHKLVLQTMEDGQQQALPAPYYSPLYSPLIEIGDRQYQSRCLEHFRCPMKDNALIIATYINTQSIVTETKFFKDIREILSIDLATIQKILDTFTIEHICRIDGRTIADQHTTRILPPGLASFGSKGGPRHNGAW